MGLRKPGAATESTPQAGTPAAHENGTQAAADRLNANKWNPDVAAQTKKATPSNYKPRDFDAEARGKTRCVQYEAALMSPAIAGLKFNTLEEFLALVRQAAEAGVAYTFGEDKRN